VYAKVQYRLVQLYEAEKGRFGHDTNTVRWFQKAGGNGIAEGYSWVGMMYLEGRGEAKSKTNAMKYLLSAAKRGEVNTMGSCHVMSCHECHFQQAILA